jgi:nicotinate-nucleotide pyrophosphorylase (carboxylating)
LARAIRDSLAEDGPDLTSNAVFGPADTLCADLVAKEESLLAGIYLVPMVLEETARLEPGEWTYSGLAEDGDRLFPGAVAASIAGSARVILRAERVILNFLCHLSGIANLTASYVKALTGTGVRLLDTRKTLPGLRYPEKYAVLVGGGCNHRKNLGELLMLKDNHVDTAGSIEAAVLRVREACAPTLPVEVECRTVEEAREAASLGVSRIMLDNMAPEMVREALAHIPPAIEVEISGGVSLENIAALAATGGARKAGYISVGRLTHSAPAADFSMRIGPDRKNAGKAKNSLSLPPEERTR